MTKEQKDKIEESLLELKYVCLNEDQYANGVDHLYAVYKASKCCVRRDRRHGGIQI